MTATQIPGLSFASRLARLPMRYIGRAPLKVALQRPLVSFTFDDVPQSAVTVGAAALEARGWRGTYFASGCFIGQETFYGPMMTAADLRQLERRGHEIGCHTYAHMDVRRHKVRAIKADLVRNAQALAAVGLKRPSPVFAYPFGEASVASKLLLASQYIACRSVRQGINRGTADRAFLKAVPIDGGEEGIVRALGYVAEAAREPGWLILYTHDIQPQPSRWGCTPADFRRVADAVAASGADVLPMHAALQTILAEDEAPLLAAE